MRTIRILACLVAAFAVSAVAVASAAAAPEFDAESYPVEVKSQFTNLQGFEIPGAVSVCRKGTVNSNEEGAAIQQKILPRS